MAQKHKLLVFPETYPTKDEGNRFIGKIKNQILDYPQELSVNQIAKVLKEKHPVAFGYGKRHSTIRKGYRKSDWIQQSIVAIDVDNAVPGEKKQAEGEAHLTMKQAMAICKEKNLPPVFCYHTLSSTPLWERYRIVWALDRPVKTKRELQCIMRAILSAFTKKTPDGTIRFADEKCIDLSRIFYGGQDICYLNATATLCASDLVREGRVHITEYFHKKDLDKHAVLAHYKNEGEIDTGYETLDAVIEELIRYTENPKKDEVLHPECPETVGIAGFGSPASNALLDLDSMSGYEKAKSLQTLAAQGFVNSQYVILKRINLNKFLFGSDSTCFNCVLPSHLDSKPSASIYLSDDGWRYHCFSCNVDCDIFELLERLTGKTHLEVRKYLCAKFGFPFETEWQHRHREELEELISQLLDKSFKEDHPILYDTMMKNNKFGTYTIMIEMARRLLLDKRSTNTEIPMFFFPKSEMQRVMPIFGFRSSLTVMTHNIKALERYGLIKEYADDEIPKVLLDKLLLWKKKRQYIYRSSVYSILPLTPERIEYAEKQIVREKQLNIRRGNMNRAQIVMADKDKADEIYVQQRGEELSPAVLNFYKRYKSAAKNLIEKKGYTCEKEIYSRIKGGYSYKAKVALSVTCMPRLLQDLGLRKVPFTKQIEKDYGVISTRTYKYTYGASRIIIPKGDKQEK